MIKRVLSKIKRVVTGTPSYNPSMMSQHPDYKEFDVGEWTFGHPTVMYHRPGRQLTVGRFCSIAWDCVIMLGGNHNMNYISTYAFGHLMNDDFVAPDNEATKGNVTIGHDCWVANGSLILSGVTIGHGAIVGARSVVAKDVPPYGIVAGNPAKFIRYRIPEHLIPKMLEIAWWDWPIEKIKEARTMLLSPNIEEFIERYHPDAITSKQTTNINL